MSEPIKDIVIPLILACYPIVVMLAHYLGYSKGYKHGYHDGKNDKPYTNKSHE
jgi:hypothetical protein